MSNVLLDTAQRVLPRDTYYRHVVSYWESGIHRPDAWTLDRLEALFGRRLRP